jgi:hypothetical protein
MSTDAKECRRAITNHRLRRFAGKVRFVDFFAIQVSSWERAEEAEELDSSL